ncbi:MAG: proline dehydrogenase family protein [Desulfobacterales bacterium]|nr:proline dehydrogenase family protein [Desulfobacterales bacterium]
MHLWQRAMIFLATHPGIKTAIQSKSFTRGLAHRFVGGENENSALLQALTLENSGIAVSFFYLGEYVRNPQQITQTISSLETAMAKARKAGLDLHISIDPTQAGLMQSMDICRNNLYHLARIIKKHSMSNAKDMLMIDMEDAGVTDQTLNIFHDLADYDLPVAITLQACLFRTPKDLTRAMGRHCPIRLVKGAFAEKRHIALRPGKPVDHAYLSLARTLLDPAALEKGVYPVFATHDEAIIRQVIELADSRQISNKQYEFEMLFGVRPTLQRQLARKGLKVRVNMPYGKDFWPYAIRRVGENPKNIKFLIRSMNQTG